MERECVKCKAKWGLQRHHVTYKPVKIALLCPRCHKAITLLNTVVGLEYKTHRKWKVEYTNVVRLAVWYGFLKGKG